MGNSCEGTNHLFIIQIMIQTVNAKDRHTKPKSTVRQDQTITAANRGVPVNLTYKLTRNQQTVKFESISAGFPNNSHTLYRQGSADTKNDNRSDRINVY